MINKKRVVFLMMVFLMFTLPAFSQKGNTVQQSKKIPANNPAAVQSANAKKAAMIRLQYFVIHADSSTYGYRIYSDGQLYIEQTTIPALPGNRGFADPASAGKAAELVIQKIKQGEMPPTISIADLKKLNINQ